MEKAMITLENSLVRYSFGHGGNLTGMYIKASGTAVGLSEKSAACIKINLGDGENEDASFAFVSGSCNQIASVSVNGYDGGTAAEFTWNDLADFRGGVTGIYLIMKYSLDDDAEFLRISTRLVNGGRYDITGLNLGIDALGLSGEPENQVLTVPDSSLGHQVVNPRAVYGSNKAVFTIPPTVPGGLACTWLDIGGDGFGFGTGYLNRQGMDMLGDFYAGEDGFCIGWRFFRYKGGWTFMEEINGPMQIYPLRPGESFITDDWFIGLHSGDWHKTARFYRSEYERVFEGDFLKWEDVSPAVKKADVIFADSAAWADKLNEQGAYEDYETNGVLRHSFAEIADRLEESVGKTGIKPENCLLVLLGQASHWGIYKLPDYFPACKQAGGDAGFVEMIRRMRRDIGISGTHFYAHTSFNHREAEYFVKSADTGRCPLLYANFEFLGKIACIDDDGWQQLWRDKIIPGFAERGASGIEFDEGFGHHFICFDPSHRHGNSAVSILTAQVRGMLNIFRECRRVFGADGYLETEGCSDTAARLFDLWESGMNRSANIVRYTHPDKLTTVFAGNDEAVYLAFVYGLPFLRYIDGFIGSGADLHAASVFITLRRKIRDENAYGYPYGFRDEDGLTVTDGLFAKLYADENGITVAYYSKEGGDCTIAVDPAAAGLNGAVQEHKINAKPDSIGYITFPAEKTKLQ